LTRTWTGSATALDFLGSRGAEEVDGWRPMGRWDVVWWRAEHLDSLVFSKPGGMRESEGILRQLLARGLLEV